jgi:hypothetical protein
MKMFPKHFTSLLFGSCFALAMLTVPWATTKASSQAPTTPTKVATTPARHVPAVHLSCEQMKFQDPDDQKFCIAKRSAKPESCNSIGKLDTRNMCLAQLSTKASYCQKVTDRALQKSCLLMTDPAHKDATHRGAQ